MCAFQSIVQLNANRNLRLLWPCFVLICLFWKALASLSLPLSWLPFVVISTFFMTLSREVIVQKVSLTYRYSCPSAIAGNLPPYGTTYTVAERPSDRKVLGSNSSGNTRNSFYPSMQLSFADWCHLSFPFLFTFCCEKECGRHMMF